jgi:hypothetical protein
MPDAGGPRVRHSRISLSGANLVRFAPIADIIQSHGEFAFGPTADVVRGRMVSYHGLQPYRGRTVQSILR